MFFVSLFILSCKMTMNGLDKWILSGLKAVGMTKLRGK